MLTTHTDMGYPVTVALRYLGSKKRAFISVGTVFAMLGVALGVAALAIVMSVTGGFQEQFREKVLGVNAHVIVLKYSAEFRDYREIMKKVETVPGVAAVAPFIINPMMVTHGERTATGVLLKGVDPVKLPQVLDLPRHIVEGSLDGMRKPGAKPPKMPHDDFGLPEHGANDGADAGARLPLLQAIEKQIAEDEAEEASLDGGAAAPAVAADETTPPEPTLAPDAPTGSVTPDGGFASQLPDDDVVPDMYESDPCKSPERIKDLPGVVVGRSLQKRLDLKLGDCLQITSPTIGMSFGSRGARAPIAKQFRLIAVFEAGFDQYDSKLAYTDLYEAQAFYDQGDSVTGVEMKVDNIDDAARIAKEIDGKLASGIFHTMDWRELNRGLFTALLIQQVMMSVVLALIIVVAAFTVIATLIMVVLDKRKEIALLKALGARDDAIMRMFLYQGGIIGVVGTSVGLVLGWLGCKGLVMWGFPLDPKVYFISKLPVNLRPTEFIVTGLIAIVICLVATVFPALYAARLRPSDGLRAD